MEFCKCDHLKKNHKHSGECRYTSCDCEGYKLKERPKNEYNKR